MHIQRPLIHAVKCHYPQNGEVEGVAGPPMVIHFTRTRGVWLVFTLRNR